MSRTELASQTCSIARAVNLVGDEWSILIIREMFLGTRRFDDFLRQTGMSSHLLSKRLKKLEGAGILRREQYSDRPPRYEYRLTAMGRDLWPIVVSFKQRGDRWLDGTETHVRIVHKSCGRHSQPQMTCSICGKPMTAFDAEPELSPKYDLERQTKRKHP